jgi:hypothetical protein
VSNGCHIARCQTPALDIYPNGSVQNYTHGSRISAESLPPRRRLSRS